MIINPSIQTFNLSTGTASDGSVLNVDLSNFELLHTFNASNHSVNLTIPDLAKQYFIVLNTAQQEINILNRLSSVIFTYKPSNAGVGSSYNYGPLLILFKFSSEK